MLNFLKGKIVKKLKLFFLKAYNSVGLEYTPDKRKVSSSSLFRPRQTFNLFFNLRVYIKR